MASGDLTGKQKAFIEEYFKDFNATRAAQRAGYRGNENVLAVTGSDNLRKPKIQKRISARLAAMCMDSDEVLRRLGEQARSDIGEFLESAGTLDLGAARRKGITHLIKSITQTENSTRIELYSAQRALELIGKAHALFRERHEHTGPDGEPISVKVRPDLQKLTNDELYSLRAIAERLEAAAESSAE